MDKYNGSSIKRESDHLPLYTVSLGHSGIVRIPMPIIPDAGCPRVQMTIL